MFYINYIDNNLHPHQVKLYWNREYAIKVGWARWRNFFPNLSPFPSPQAGFYFAAKWVSAHFRSKKCDHWWSFIVTCLEPEVLEAELETRVRDWRLESVFCWLATCLRLARYDSRLDVKDLRLTWDLSLMTWDLTAPTRICNGFREYRRITYICSKNSLRQFQYFYIKTLWTECIIDWGNDWLWSTSTTCYSLLRSVQIKYNERPTERNSLHLVWRKPRPVRNNENS